MVIELVVRFVLGGVVVTAVAVLGDVLQPKSFAVIFGAAPSVALATLGLTFASHGGSYAGLEGRSMIAGSAAFLLYTVLTSRLLLKRTGDTLVVASIACTAWLALAFGLWGLFLR